MISVQRTRLLLGVIGFWPVTTFAYDMERALVNLAADFSNCAAYCAIVANLPQSSPEVAEGYADASVNLLQMAIESSNEKVAKARMELAIKDMSAELNGDLGNMSVLINEYSEMCQELSNDLEPRLQYWLDKED